MAGMTVLCDVDDTVADLLTPWIGRFNRDHGTRLTREDFTEWDIGKIIGEHQAEAMYAYLKDATLYDEVEPIPGARWGVDTIRARGHRVVFVTSASGPAMGAKLSWLIRHGFLPGHTFVHPDFVAAHDKALIRGNLLIDDRPKNIAEFPGGDAILFDQPHNRSVPALALLGVSRAKSWSDVVDLVRAIERRRAA